MRILILGGDGYLGWPTAMKFCAEGHEVCVADSYLKRNLMRNTNSKPLFEVPKLDERVKIFHTLYDKSISYFETDLSIADNFFNIFKEFCPEVIIHYAEQPSAPLSMKSFKDAHLTFSNNLNVTFNCVWAMMKFAPNAHLIKLGTMGEYGTPNIDIPEGWIDIDHNGRRDKFLFPRAASSLYHTTKVLDTDLLWFYVRTYGLRVTDLMQGPVYGVFTAESSVDDRLKPHYSYDDIFGTVINRFIVQAVMGIPLTVYGMGGQTRGYINIVDTLNCIKLAMQEGAKSGELKIFNQVTETLSVKDIANLIKKSANKMGINVEINSVKNPRKEKEEHYYNPAYSSFRDLGLEPTLISEDVVINLLKFVSDYRENIDPSIIAPRVIWN